MSRYATASEQPKGPGDARPTALQIVEDEGLKGKLGDKVMVVTGGSAGIGVETVRALHATGATVFTTVRNVPKGQAVVDEILASDTSNKAPIHLIKMEEAAKEILQRSGGKVNVLVNNAGVMATPYGLTKDGFETQFATNHLAHFLLFQLLKDALLSSATPDFPSRVVSVSSSGHKSDEVHFDDFNYEKDYVAWNGYNRSKTANVWFANEIERRYGPRNLHATSVHPGWIMTGLQIHVQEAIDAFAKDESLRCYMKSPGQGAATSVYAALGAEWAHKGGRYLADCIEQGPAGPPSGDMIKDDVGHAPWAYDEEKEGRLWKESLRMVEVQDDE